MENTTNGIPTTGQYQPESTDFNELYILFLGQ